MSYQITIGEALANEGMVRATNASCPDAIAQLDQIIAEHAATGEPFSANDVRPHLPEEVRPAAVGGRFRHAARRGVIRPIGYVASTDPGTHAHPVRLWKGATA